MAEETFNVPITIDPAFIFAYSEWISANAAKLKNPNAQLNTQFINTHNILVAAFVAAANIGASAMGYVLSNLIVPNIPSTPASSAVTANGATLGCDAMPQATGYIFQYKVATSNTWIAVAPTSEPTTTLAGLAISTTYQWQVAGVFPSGNSAFCTLQTFTTPAV